MSIPAPFEVQRDEHGWHWCIIGPCGRPLVYTDDRFPDDFAAAEAAKEARASMADRAALVDAGSEAL